MKKIILLRGVTPTGTNRIPKMSYLVEILTEVGFLNVQTYIQSGNILLESELSDEEIRKLVHDTILDKIGADLSIIIKEINQLEIAIQENPFDNTYDSSRIHLVFTNEQIPESTLTELSREYFGDEEFYGGHECCYLYLPRDARKKRLNTNYLEKKIWNSDDYEEVECGRTTYEIIIFKQDNYITFHILLVRGKKLLFV